MPDERTIPCEDCRGDGGFYDFGHRWEKCRLCDGKGEYAVEYEAIDQFDMDMHDALEADAQKLAALTPDKRRDGQ